MTSHVDDAEDDADVDGNDYGFVECEDGDAEVGSDAGPEAGAGSAVVHVDKVAQQSTGDSGHAATRQEVIEIVIKSVTLGSTFAIFICFAGALEAVTKGLNVPLEWCRKARAQRSHAHSTSPLLQRGPMKHMIWVGSCNRMAICRA